MKSKAYNCKNDSSKDKLQDPKARLKALLKDFKPSVYKCSSDDKTKTESNPMLDTSLINFNGLSTQASFASIATDTTQSAPKLPESIIKNACKSKAEVQKQEQEVDSFSPMLVPADPNLYKKTKYFQCFESTPRYPDLEEAVSELASIFEPINREGKSLAKKIMKIYEDSQSLDQAICVTMIWTLDRVITKLINCALVVDAVNQYGYDKKLFQFYFDHLKQK